MQRVRFSILILLLAGCDSLGKSKVENPVMPPAPPRLSMQESPGTATIAASGRQTKTAAGPEDAEPGAVIPVDWDELRQTAAEESPDSKVIGTVNGEPIFASDLIAAALMDEKMGAALVELHQAAKRGQVTQEFIRQQHEPLLRGMLPNQVDAILLAQGMRPELMPEQIASIEEQLAKAFDDEVVPLLQERLQVQSRPELERAAREYGTSLQTIRKGFVLQQTATQFVRHKRGEIDAAPRRPELLAYYEEHREEFATTARVKWQQILVSHRKHGGEKPAFEVLEKAVDEIKAGKSFDEVARAYSDGPTADKGGYWDWTLAGSLADEKVNEALFALPVGKISEVFVGKDTYQLVKVTEREDASYTPFEELQTKIAETIHTKARQKAARDLIEELRAKAEIKTVFDQKAGAARVRQ